MRSLRCRGLTTIELMVTMMVLALLMAVAVPSMKEFKRNSELVGAADNLLASATLARTEALKSGAPSFVVPVDGSWSRGWKVFVDRDRNGDYDEGTDAWVGEYAPESATLGWSGGGTAAADTSGGPYLRFDESGYARAKDGAFAASTVSFARTDVSSASQVRRVKVARTGRVRACKPGSDGDTDCSPDP